MVGEDFMKITTKILILLTCLTGVTAQAQITEVDKIFDLRGVDSSDAYYLERISVPPGHAFEKDPWLEVAKQMVKVDDFIKIDPYTGSDDFKDVDGTSGLYSVLNAGGFWEKAIVDPILASELQKPIRGIHKMNPNKENDMDVIISEFSSPVPMEFRQTNNVWVWSIKLSSPLGKEAARYFKSILLPHSKARDEYSYFRQSKGGLAHLRECVFWEDGETFFLSGSKVGFNEARGHRHLNCIAANQFWFSLR
ncbi:MAG: hypothetical protein KAG66_06300, partial [Methylococcales bacterium]|nr:hypothetical protein [Methylococcales bacterium]